MTEITGDNTEFGHLKGVDIGIHCRVCGGFIPKRYISENVFPICDECIEILKEVILNLKK